MRTTVYIYFILSSCKILGQITWWFRTKCQAVTYFTENQWSEFVVKMYCIWKFLRLPWLFGLLVFPFYCHILSFKRAQLTAFTIKVHDYTLRRPQGVSKLNMGDSFNRSNYIFSHFKFLTSIILDGTHEKIVSYSHDFFLVYIQKFLPTLAWKCRM